MADNGIGATTVALSGLSIASKFVATAIVIPWLVNCGKKVIAHKGKGRK